MLPPSNDIQLHGGFVNPTVPEPAAVAVAPMFQNSSQQKDAQD